MENDQKLADTNVIFLEPITALDVANIHAALMELERGLRLCCDDQRGQELMESLIETRAKMLKFRIVE